MSALGGTADSPTFRIEGNVAKKPIAGQPLDRLSCDLIPADSSASVTTTVYLTGDYAADFSPVSGATTVGSVQDIPVTVSSLGDGAIVQLVDVKDGIGVTVNAGSAVTPASFASVVSPVMSELLDSMRTVKAHHGGGGVARGLSERMHTQTCSALDDARIQSSFGGRITLVAEDFVWQRGGQGALPGDVVVQGVCDVFVLEGEDGPETNHLHVTYARGGIDRGVMEKALPSLFNRVSDHDIDGQPVVWWTSKPSSLSTKTANLVVLDEAERWVDVTGETATHEALTPLMTQVLAASN